MIEEINLKNLEIDVDELPKGVYILFDESLDSTVYDSGKLKEKNLLKLLKDDCVICDNPAVGYKTVFDKETIDYFANYLQKVANDRESYRTIKNLKHKNEKVDAVTDLATGETYLDEDVDNGVFGNGYKWMTFVHEKMHIKRDITQNDDWKAEYETGEMLKILMEKYNDTEIAGIAEEAYRAWKWRQGRLLKKRSNLYSDQYCCQTPTPASGRWYDNLVPYTWKVPLRITDYGLRAPVNYGLNLLSAGIGEKRTMKNSVEPIDELIKTIDDTYKAWRSGP